MWGLFFVKIEAYMNYLKYTAALILLVMSNVSFGQTVNGERNLVNHVEYLTSDNLKGREAGSEGEMLAAKYLYDQLKNAGVEMLSGENGQDFYIVENGDSLNSRNILAYVIY